MGKSMNTHSLSVCNGKGSSSARGLSRNGHQKAGSGRICADINPSMRQMERRSEVMQTGFQGGVDDGSLKGGY